MATSGKLAPSEWTPLWWLTDNANVKKMLAKGWGKLIITCLVLEILQKGRILKFEVNPIWVSRDNPFLQKADCLSKGIDSDNWEVSASNCEHLEEKFGPSTIDLFATCGNTKCERFYARSFEEGTSDTDAFAQKWDGERAYAAPPVTLVMRTICKAAASNMSGLLLVPLLKGPKF
jgi:hypothetical protein